jgi:hypothetical protein
LLEKCCHLAIFLPSLSETDSSNRFQVVILKSFFGEKKPSQLYGYHWFSPLPAGANLTNGFTSVRPRFVRPRKLFDRTRPKRNAAFGESVAKLVKLFLGLALHYICSFCSRVVTSILNMA